MNELKNFIFIINVVNAFFVIFIMILNIIYERKHNHTWEILDLAGGVCAGIAIGMLLILAKI